MDAVAVSQVHAPSSTPLVVDDALQSRLQGAFWVQDGVVFVRARHGARSAILRRVRSALAEYHSCPELLQRREREALMLAEQPRQVSLLPTQTSFEVRTAGLEQHIRRQQLHQPHRQARSCPPCRRAALAMSQAGEQNAGHPQTPAKPHAAARQLNIDCEP